MTGIATPPEVEAHAANAVAVATGYKRTELGVIPEEWDVLSLGKEIASLEAGVSVKSKPEGEGGLSHTQYILKTSAVSSGHFFESESKPIAPGDIPLARVNPRADTILISRMNTPALVGECGYVERDCPDLFLPDRLWMTRFRPESTISARWLSYLLSSAGYKKRIKAAATGTSGSMKNISKTALLSLPIPRPSVKEQCAIAEVLSDVDRLIWALAKLIAKKWAIKQGTMQQLITGRTRLHGFRSDADTRETSVGPIPAEWDVRLLGDLGPWKGGSTPSMVLPRYWEGGDVPWVSSSDVRTGLLNRTQESITRKAVAETTVPLLPPGSILVVIRSGILRRFLPVAQTTREMAINQDIKGLAPKPMFDSSFIREMLYLKQAQILATCLKSGTTVESLDTHWFKAFPIPFPSRQEQEAIAAVLSDMDAEIAALEQRRDKTKAIKQGMMQSLLTGRVRLINQETVA